MKNTYKILPVTAKLSVSVVLILIVNCSLLGQITWQRTYNFSPYNQNDYAYTICSSSDGNFIVAGTGANGGICVIKINPLGDTLWSSVLIDGVAYSIIGSSDGGCILTGYGDTAKAFTIKLSGNGSIVWNKSYGGENVRLNCIIMTDDGSYVACGSDWRANIDGLIIKIDNLGNLIWTKYYLAGFDKSLYSITETLNGHLLVTGIDESTYGGGVPSKTLVMKLTSGGDSIWIKRYNMNSASSLGQSIRIFSNNYIVCGITGDSSNPGRICTFIMKLDSSGSILKSSVYTLGPNEAFLSFHLSHSTYIFTTSTVYSPNYIEGKVYLADTSGTIYLQKGINDTAQVELHSILSAQNGDLLFAGYKGDNGPTRNDFFVLRTDSMLNFPPIGIQNQSTYLTNLFLLYQNYPNPFNPTTKIKYELKVRSNVKIEIFDMLGRRVETLINAILSAGVYYAVLKTDTGKINYSCGIFFLRMSTSSGFVDTKKIILLK